MPSFACRAAAGFVALAAGASATLGQLRVANWNISFYDGTNRTADIQTAVYDIFGGRSLAPDVFALQEFASATALSTFVSVLNTAPHSPGDWAAAPFLDGPDSQAVLVYRTSKADLLQAVVVATGSSATTDQPRNTYRYDLRAKGYNSTNATFAVYSVHLKAGSTASDNTRRLVETTHIRDNASGVNTNGPGTALPAGYHFIVSGDLNVQSATQSAYQKLVSNVGGSAGQLFDPIQRPGAWNGSSTYRFIHTQDPSGSGGMDDRHDQILLSASLLDGTGMDYIGSLTTPWDLSRWDDPNHSYRCWGNDGTSFNLTLTVAGNTNVGPTIAQALKNAATTAGGHLPVFLELKVPAKVAAPAAVNFGSVVQGSSASSSAAVGNGGDVALWTIPGIAGLSYTLSASAGFSAPSGTFSDAAGGALNSHTITMSTATPGIKTGTLTITATGADVPSVVIPLSGTVAPPNQPPIASAGPDQTLTDSDGDGFSPVTLNGSGSSDPDGAITRYVWREGTTVLSDSTAPTAVVTLPVGVHTIALTVTDNSLATAGDSVLITINPGIVCGTADFNGDGDIGTDQDIEAFFRCLAGDCCATCFSGGADFNGDGDIGTDGDIEAFFRVLAGGTC